MAVFPRKPQAGDRAMQSMYDAICNIIDFLPSLEIRGDNRTIKIDSFASGKTISAVPQTTAANSGSTENWPKLAKIVGKTAANIYLIRFVDINGAFITEDDENYVYASSELHCLIPGLSLYSNVPKGTLILVSPVTTYALEGGAL